MNKERRAAIIHDLLALYERYEVAEIKDAIAAIERGDLFRDVVSLVKSAESIRCETERQRVYTATRRRTPKERFSAFVQDLERDDSDSDRQVAQFVRGVGSRNILRNAGSLREFAGALGIGNTGAKLDRFVLARRIGEELLKRSHQKRGELIEMAGQLGGEESSLREWSRIIVKK
jgi:hypothetical protein